MFAGTVSVTTNPTVSLQKKESADSACKDEPWPGAALPGMYQQMGRWQVGQWPLTPVHNQLPQ